jgi:hypothetical protein
MVKKNLPKKKTKRTAASKRFQKRTSDGEETLFFEWLRERVKFYCQDPSVSKKEQIERREELSEHLGIQVTTLKGQYLYGQNKENIYKAAIYIGAIDENVLMNFIECYPSIVDDLNALPEYQRKFYKNFRKLNNKELELLSRFVENLLELNDKYS